MQREISRKHLDLMEKVKDVLEHDVDGDPCQEVARALIGDIEELWKALKRHIKRNPITYQ